MFVIIQSRVYSAIASKIENNFHAIVKERPIQTVFVMYYYEDSVIR